jgi:hypothetical protein
MLHDKDTHLLRYCLECNGSIPNDRPLQARYCSARCSNRRRHRTYMRKHRKNQWVVVELPHPDGISPPIRLLSGPSAPKKRCTCWTGEPCQVHD